MWEHDLEIKRLTEELERTLWEHDIEIKNLTEELELTMWEHEAELSIYLEVVGERAREWAHIIDISAADFSCKQVFILSILCLTHMYILNFTWSRLEILLYCLMLCWWHRAG